MAQKKTFEPEVCDDCGKHRANVSERARYLDEPTYTPEPKKPRRKQRKRPAPSSPELERQRVWAEVRERHAR
jgi:hypothetical protein